MKTVIVGNRKLARQLLRHTLREDWNVVGAIAPKGSLATEQANFVPMEGIVDGTSCQLHRTSDINNDQTIRWLESISPDICISGGWSQVIHEKVLHIPHQSFLGFHASRLPKGRGGAPVNWSIIDGDAEIWTSLFHYVSEIDAGDVLARGSVLVEDRDDVGTVFESLAIEACNVLESVRDELESHEAPAEEQRLMDATYRPRRQPQDGLIDWELDPKTQYDWVRAQTEPYPGAYSFHDGEKLRILQGEPLSESSPPGSAPGEIVTVVPGQGLDVRSGKGLFRIERIKEGNSPSRWADRYATDIDMAPGNRFGRDFAPNSWLYTGIRGPEDPITFETNIEIGDSGRINLVVFSGSNRRIVEKVWLNDELIFHDAFSVESSSRNQVKYTPQEAGTNDLRVEFEANGSLVDKRYLKIYSH